MLDKEKDELISVKGEGLSYATVRDGLNRDNDPHLHTHVVVFNITKYKGKPLTLDAKKFLNKDFNKFWDQMYKAKLKHYLEEMDYKISYTNDGMWRMEDVSHEMEKEFSKRRISILEAKKAGLSDMAAWDKTRKEKNHLQDKEAIVEDWTRRAMDKDFPIRYNEERTKIAKEEWMQNAIYSLEAQQMMKKNTVKTEIERWFDATQRATEGRALVTKEQIMTEYMKEYMYTESKKLMTKEMLEIRFDEMTKKEYIPKIEEGIYSSWDIMRAERQCMIDIKKNLDINPIDEKNLDKLLKEYQKRKQKTKSPVLDKLQLEAVKSILKSNKHSVIQGDAGSGKTTMMEGVKAVCDELDMKVIGVCMQGVAARNLEEETNIKAMTLASFLSSGEEIRNHVIVFDEASMIDSRNCERLLQKAGRDNKIVFVGDKNQLTSIHAGNVFERFVEEKEKTECAAELQRILQ